MQARLPKFRSEPLIGSSDSQWFGWDLGGWTTELRHSRSLETGIAYRLILNPEGMKAFRSKDGIPLKEYILCFTTKAMP